MLNIKFKGMEHRAPCKQYSFLTKTLFPLGGVKRAKDFCSESCHVAYQIKRNGKKNTFQAHILSLHTLSASGVGVKGQNIFSKNRHVAYQI